MHPGNSDSAADLIRLKAVEVGYQGKAILPALDLTIRRMSSLGIVGPNGSGKTTLLRTLLGLLPPVRGKVSYGGARPRFGYVPQGESVDKSFPAQARDVVMMGRYPRIPTPGIPRARDREIVAQSLERVGLTEHARRPYGALSGGQRQRVLVARALAGEPEILILDEPTTGMDLVSEQALLDLVGHAADQLGIAVIFVSHALGSVANAVKDILLVDRECKVVEAGPVAEIITSTRLSVLYHRDVRVVEDLHGHRMVIVEPGGKGATHDHDSGTHES